jgi:hypothetical protein
MITNFFPPLSFVTVFGSGIRDPGSGMGKNQLVTQTESHVSVTIFAQFYFYKSHVVYPAVSMFVPTFAFIKKMALILHW